MADFNNTNHPVESDGLVAMSLARKEAARTAASEIEMLSIVLRHSTEHGDGLQLIVRGISKRMEQMAQVVMSAVDDESADVDTLFQDIGCKYPY